MWGQPPRLSAGRSPACFGFSWLMRKKFILSVIGTLFLSSCSPRDFLTRRLATDLIAASDAFKAPQQFALQTGIVSNKDYVSPEYIVLQQHGWIAANSAKCPAGTPPPCWDVLLTPSGVDTIRALVPAEEAEKPLFFIPVAKRELVAVTGISKQGNLADVDFTWKWVPLNEVGAALYSADLHYSSTVAFRDYDDGWRIVATPAASRIRADARRRPQERRAYPVTSSAPAVPAWINSAANWLTPNRIRAQAIVLALCLWGVCAVDFATPGLFDRAGNIKFQDFLQFYISARLITARPQQPALRSVGRRSGNACHRPRAHSRAASHRLRPASRPAVHAVSKALVPGGRAHLGRAQPARRRRVHLSAVEIVHRIAIARARCRPLRRRLSPALSFLRARPNLRLAVALLLRRISGVPRRSRLARRIRSRLPRLQAAVSGRAFRWCCCWRGRGRRSPDSSSRPPAQLALTTIYFGTAVMRAYFDTLLHISRWVGLSEIGLAHIQMHSLRSFFALLIPWPRCFARSIRLEFDCGNRNRRGHLEIFRHARRPLFRADPRRRAGQSASVHLRPAGPGSSFSAAGRLDVARQARGRAGAACAFVSLLHAAFVGPALAMDTRPTLRPRLCRVIVGPVGHFQNSQICLEPTRRCITLLPIWSPMRIQKIVVLLAIILSCTLAVTAQSKPKLTLDEFFNSVSFPAVEISPDGNSVVIVTERADWDQQIFRKDLWLYHDDGQGDDASRLARFS